MVKYEHDRIPETIWSLYETLQSNALRTSASDSEGKNLLAQVRTAIRDFNI